MNLWRAIFVTFFLVIKKVVSHNEFSIVTEEPEFGPERVVFQTKYGDIEFGFYPKVAPVTSHHILKLAKLGCYNTNHFFRVDKGFVAQVADVIGGTEIQLNSVQTEEGRKSIIGEFSRVKHTRGILSMGRWDDPNSATSSFSMLLGDAPHLDEQYAVFGKVTRGYDVLSKLEQLPTKTEGIFVMPLERITILSTYVYEVSQKVPEEVCDEELKISKRKVTQLQQELHDMRVKCLP